MDELRTLACMRDEVPEPTPEQVSRVQARLDPVLRLDRAPGRPRTALRLGLATGLAVVVALAGAAVLVHGHLPASNHQATPRGTPEIVLAAAAAKSTGTSFRFHATATNTSSNHETDIDGRGVWDPNGPKANVSYYDARGHLSIEYRLNGHDLWYHLPGKPWGHMLQQSPSDQIGARFLHSPIIHVDPQTPDSLAHSSKGPLGAPPAGHPRSSPPVTSAEPTFDPGSLLKQLLDNGAQTTDLGVSGSGANAVHTYGFRVQLPPIKDQPRAETGTIVVSMATGKITKLAWSEPGLVPEVPYQSTVYTSALEYYDYGIPVEVNAP